MSETEATSEMEESVALEGEKVKVMNGVKEMGDKSEVKMQNGDSEKSQINGDIEKMDDSEVSEDHSAGSGNDVSNSEEQSAEPYRSEELSPRPDSKASKESSDDSAKVDSRDKANSEPVDSAKAAAGEPEATKESSVSEDTSAPASESKEESEMEVEESSEKKDEAMDVDKSEGADEKTNSALESEKEPKKKSENETSKSDEKMDATEAPSAPEKADAPPKSEEKSDAKEGEGDQSDKKDSSEKAEKEIKSEVLPEPATPVGKGKKAKKDKSEEVQEILPTRQLRVRRTPRKYTEDDDDIKIEKEVIKDDSGDDIQMIEESDPLAISDADVKKAQQKEKKEIIKSKDPNVIIIDTNTLLKNQGNLAAAVAQSSSSASVISTPTAVSTASVATATTSINASVNTSHNAVSSVNIQTAIQAITGGVPAQGLQSAYITALQQVLLAQGGQVPMNSHHLAQLQQYYNSLGHLQDDAYVIEAPSFIVPYVMEGKPKEPIKAFLRRINKELEEYEKEKKKEEEEKKKKEEEEKKKEEDEIKGKEKDPKRKESSEEEGSAKDSDEETTEKKVDSSENKEKTEGSTAENKDESSDDKSDSKNNTKTVDETSKDADKENSNKEENKENRTSTSVTSTKDKSSKDDKEKSDTDSVVEMETSEKKEEDLTHLGKWEPYYRSTLGKFILDLGLNQAQEFLQSDLLRMQKKKLEKMKTVPSKEGIVSVKVLEKQLELTRQKNSHLRVPLKICKFCNFKTESEMVMDRHLESPHMVNYTYKCNFCEFETRGPQVILFHMEAEHNIRGRLERAPAFFQCSLCPYEDNNKSKMTRHSFSCAKKYKPEKNCELADWEPPAKIPKVHRGRPNTLGKAFEPVKMPNLLPKGLAGMNINLQSAVAANLLTTASANSAALAAGRGRGRPVGSYKTTGQIINQGRGASPASLLYSTRGVTTGNLVQQVGGNAQQFTLGNQMFHSTGRVPRILPSSSASNVSLIPGLAASSSITIQSVQSKAGNTKSPQQPSISITPLPRGGQQPQNVTKGTTPTRDASGKPSFVICEICDGYIKDLEQLRNHMNLIHKVKIHPKMIYNRPPLNCQKCQHRFFTDQGLERHLLGTHGLVTSSMQEAANKGKDAGRCPICGKVFQWKLLNHVSRDHKMTLKPAHLSYKCTVCTATFNMYRLFENHVYSAHSVVNKNKGDNNKKQGGSGSSDPPLKINDEITIIPQPAAKSSKPDNITTPGKKSGNSPSVSKEITITKVGSRPTRRSGGSSVEVISLDDSPKKADKRTSKDNAGNSSKKVKASS
ncbi:MOG interacting and ectopic P-granules protein 1 isoform X2 [Palaemon carinicauda]|uniref:MOG interacting and ectopic P-granules protein 1 isoform X2 n=1 Tax=Palaemon carinicauda TaxID=392227 RepID=UPI0035B57EC9